MHLSQFVHVSLFAGDRGLSFLFKHNPVENIIFKANLILLNNP